MLWNIFLFILLACNVNAFVRRDVSLTNTKPNILESFQRNIDQFRSCIDQSLAKAIGEVNEKQVEPILGVVGDQLNRISKAFEDLTATPAPQNLLCKVAQVGIITICIISKKALEVYK